MNGFIVHYSVKYPSERSLNNLFNDCVELECFVESGGCLDVSRSTSVSPEVYLRRVVRTECDRVTMSVVVAFSTRVNNSCSS